MQNTYRLMALALALIIIALLGSHSDATEYTETEIGTWRLSQSGGAGIKSSVEDHPRYGKQAIIFVSDEYVIETVLFTGISNVDLARLKTLIDETIPEL